jgi:hypothetical protein
LLGLSYRPLLLPPDSIQGTIQVTALPLPAREPPGVHQPARCSRARPAASSHTASRPRSLSSLIGERPGWRVNGGARCEVRTRKGDLDLAPRFSRPDRGESLHRYGNVGVGHPPHGPLPVEGERESRGDAADGVGSSPAAVPSGSCAR